MLNSCLIGEPVETPEYLAFVKERDERQKKLDGYVSEQYESLTKRAREQVGDYFVAVVVKQGKAPAGFQLKYEHGNPREKILERWREHLERRVGSGDTVFAPWKALAEVKPEEFEAKAPGLLEGLKTASPPSDALVLQSLIDAKPKSLVDVAAVYARLVNESRIAWEKLKSENAAAERLPDPRQQEHRRDAAAGRRIGQVGAEVERDPGRRVDAQEPRGAADDRGARDPLAIAEAEPGDGRAGEDLSAPVIERVD